MSFLKQFGISLVDFVVQDPVIVADQPEKVKKKKITKISPLGFEISDDVSVLPGTQLYVQVNGDRDDKDSDYGYVAIDEDGDAVVDIKVDVHRLNTTYIRSADGLHKIPNDRMLIDKEGDTILKLHDFVPVALIKFSGFLDHLTPPTNAGHAWYVGKFCFEKANGWSVHNGKEWVYIKMPVSDDLVNAGFYSFK